MWLAGQFTDLCGGALSYSDSIGKDKNESRELCEKVELNMAIATLNSWSV